MRLKHTAANGLVIATFQRIAHVKHTLFLADDEAGTAIVLVAHLVAHVGQHGIGSVTQGLYTQGSSHTLAGFTALVIGRIHQLVLHLAVEQHQFVALGVEGEILMLE